MARNNWQKFRLLMWKNWILQIRHPIQTFFEILVPIFFCSILVLIQLLEEVENVPDITTFKAFHPDKLPRINQSALLNRLTEINVSNVTVIHLVYSPKAPILAEVMNDVAMSISPFIPMKVQDCDDSSCVENTLMLSDALKKVGLVFSASMNDSIPDDIEFAIRFPSELSASVPGVLINDWKTNRFYPMLQLGGPREKGSKYTASPGYYQEFFLYMQSLVSRTLLKYRCKESTQQSVCDQLDQTKISMQRYSYPPYKSDPLIVVLAQLMGLIIVLAFVYTSVSIIRTITNEKEKQLKESMKIMGLPSWLHWTAWFIKSISFMLISIIVMVALFKISGWYGDNKSAIFPRCDPILMFIFLALYASSVVTLCFAISVFFNKANMAAGVGGVLFFLTYVPYTLLRNQYQYLTLGTKLAASLMCNTAMCYGFQLICMLEGTERGLQWNNLFSEVSPDDTLTMGHILLMLIIDCVVYMAIALYVEAIFPGSYGVQRKWNFVFSYFFRSQQKVEDDSMSSIPLESTQFEEEPRNATAGVDIRSLRKVYGDKVAVNGLSLRMFENQITVLLGHNGAGKTTTMSMLTGMITPTSGTAVVNGYDLRTQMTDVRTSLGLCPQHNILFDELTVSEHIYFYCCLKGMTKGLIKREIDDYLRLLQLEDKRDKRSATLSGGMKRKLSVAVAFCGGSKVVMLDEPTAGMDPAARRALWELVESQKKDRTIMLTTHFMDEADLLGDRIAIMSEGELQCCGSSFFLKKKYGAGYRLVIDKLPNCSVPKVTEALNKYIAGIQVERNVGSELTYVLSEQDSRLFEPMLTEVENNSRLLAIGSFGISLTTLEEVFMKVGTSTSYTPDLVESVNGKVSNGSDQFNQEADLLPAKYYSGYELRLNQVKAMFLKRGLSTLRSWMLLSVQLLIPILLLVFAILSATNHTPKPLPKLDLSLADYSSTVTLLQTDNNSNILYLNGKKWLNSYGFSSKDTSDINKSILSTIVENPAKFRMSYIIGAEFSENKILGWFNNEPYHSPPVALNFIYNSIFRAIGAKGQIRVSNHPLPYSLNTKFEQIQNGSSMGFEIAINIGFCMSFISAFYVLFYVRERMCKVKHLQFVCGVNTLIFWAVSFIWDWLVYMCTICALIVTLICFQEDGYKSGQDIGNLILIFFYFGFSMLPTIFVMSFLYTMPSTGFTRIVLYSIIFGTFAFMVIQVLYMEDLNFYADILDWIFIFVPHYSMSSGIRNVNFEYSRLANCLKAVEVCLIVDKSKSEDTCWAEISQKFPQCKIRQAEYYKWETPGTLRNIIISLLVGVLMILGLLLIEYKILHRIRYLLQGRKVYDDNSEEPEDADVLDERNKVNNLQFDTTALPFYSLVLVNMTKYYKNFPAVKGLCLSVKRGECFGLLGVNGAGKTSSFRMITGDTSISSGEVYVNGLNIKHDLESVYKQIGYCPQFDALFDDLTGRETIRVFCLLRGIPSAEVDYLARKLSIDFDFYEHLDKQVKQMSGGNKRKLSTAVALIGNPSIIYLDEPSTGMDPGTKRHLWNALCKLRDSGKCLILTTHSMEECEALCTRLAIMVNGKFKCLGSTQHLKNKFARGFTLTIKVKKQEFLQPLVDRINGFVKESFPSAEIREHYQELITYYIPNATLKWSSMFGIMERAKDDLDIEDYSLGQSSLEQVFLSFTKWQQESK